MGVCLTGTCKYHTLQKWSDDDDDHDHDHDDDDDDEDDDDDDDEEEVDEDDNEKQKDVKCIIAGVLHCTISSYKLAHPPNSQPSTIAS